jgi:hypothetical protein
MLCYAVLWCATCTAGLFFGPVATLEWLICSLGAMGYEGIIQDTFKIALVRECISFPHTYMSIGATASRSPRHTVCVAHCQNRPHGVVCTR